MLLKVRQTPTHCSGLRNSQRNRLPNSRANTGVRKVSELRLVRLPLEAEVENKP